MTTGPQRQHLKCIEMCQIPAVTDLLTCLNLLPIHACSYIGSCTFPEEAKLQTKWPKHAETCRNYTLCKGQTVRPVRKVATRSAVLDCFARAANFISIAAHLLKRNTVQFTTCTGSKHLLEIDSKSCTDALARHFSWKLLDQTLAYLNILGSARCARRASSARPSGGHSFGWSLIWAVT